MTAPAAPPESEAPPAAEPPDVPAPDPAQARLARDLDRLERLADHGLRIAAALAAKAETAEADVEAVALAYGRVARAVRLGTLLSSKLTEDGADRERRRRSEAEGALRQAAYAEAARDEAARAEETAARRRARGVIRRVIRAGHRDPDAIERLDSECAERLRAEDIYGWVSARPLSDAIAEICADLGLQPDWEALGRECWAVEEVLSGEVGEPLRAFAAAHPPPAPEDDDADLEDERADAGPRLTLVPSLLSGSG